MVDKTTSFKKRAKGRRGTSRRMASKLLLKWRSPSLDLSLRLGASTAKGLVIGSRTAPSIWRIRRMAKWTKVYFIYILLMFTLLVLVVIPGYLILVRLLRLVTRWYWLENSIKHYLIRKINSHLIQVIVVLRHSEHMLTLVELSSSIL